MILDIRFVTIRVRMPLTKWHTFLICILIFISISVVYSYIYIYTKGMYNQIMKKYRILYLYNILHNTQIQMYCKIWGHLAFKYFGFECIWRNLFQKRVVCIKLDIHVYITTQYPVVYIIVCLSHFETIVMYIYVMWLFAMK